MYNRVEVKRMRSLLSTKKRHQKTVNSQAHNATARLAKCIVNWNITVTGHK